MRSAAAVLLAAALAAICTQANAAPAPGELSRTSGQDFGTLQRGESLATIADCAACHREPGTGRPFAGGRPIETPFGKIIAPNITPDRDTGIGAWSDDEFVDALRAGTGRGGKHLYPAMPYPYYTKMTREDALAIRAYLATVPPVRNAVVANQLPFPFDIRASMAAWNALNFTPGAFRPDAGKSAEWNRGAFIVEGPGHCGACHTPKNPTGGDKSGEALRGSVIDGWFAPDITNAARTGLGRWSPDDVVAYLQTGHNRIAAASGPMAEAIELSTSHMTDADLRAIATYLKDPPAPQARTSADPANPLDPGDVRMKTGAAIYADECSSCHSPDGKGVPRLFPALAAAPAVQASDPASLIRVVLRGAQSAATAPAPTAPAMPPFGWLLSDTQVAGVVTYIRNAWGNAAAPVSGDGVRMAREGLAERPD